MIYSLAPAENPQLAALFQLLDRCCPYDEVMRSDLRRLHEAIAAGKCRLEPAAGAGDWLPPEGAELQGSTP
jgi:hypothetical protein